MKFRSIPQLNSHDCSAHMHSDTFDAPEIRRKEARDDEYVPLQIP